MSDFAVPTVKSTGLLFEYQCFLGREPRHTGFFNKSSQLTWTLARTVGHPWSSNFNVVWKQCLAEPCEKKPILAPAVEKWWLATLIEGVRGLPEHVETFWSMVFFWRTRYQHVSTRVSVSEPPQCQLTENDGKRWAPVRLLNYGQSWHSYESTYQRHAVRSGTLQRNDRHKWICWDDKTWSRPVWNHERRGFDVIKKPFHLQLEFNAWLNRSNASSYTLTGEFTTWATEWRSVTCPFGWLSSRTGPCPWFLLVCLLGLLEIFLVAFSFKVCEQNSREGSCQLFQRLLQSSTWRLLSFSTVSCMCPPSPSWRRWKQQQWSWRRSRRWSWMRFAWPQISGACEQILCSHFPHLSGSGCFTVLWSLWAQWHRASLPAQMDAPRPSMWRWPGLSVRLEVAEAQSILWWKGRRLWGPQSSSCGPFQSHPILGSYRLQIARQCRRRKVSGRLGARGVDGGEGRLPPIAVMESSIRGIPTFRKWAGTWKTSLQKTITFAGVWSWSSAMLCLIVQVKLFDALCRHSKTFTICLR